MIVCHGEEHLNHCNLQQHDNLEVREGNELSYAEDFTKKRKTAFLIFQSVIRTGLVMADRTRTPYPSVLGTVVSSPKFLTFDVSPCTLLSLFHMPTLPRFTRFTSVTDYHMFWTRKFSQDRNRGKKSKIHGGIEPKHSCFASEPLTISPRRTVEIGCLQREDSSMIFFEKNHRNFGNLYRECMQRLASGKFTDSPFPIRSITWHYSRFEVELQVRAHP